MNRSRQRVVVALLGIVVFLAVLVTTGRLHIRGDAVQMCGVAAALGDHGWFDVSPDRVDVVRGPDGKSYSKYPLLTVLQCAPALWFKSLGKHIGGQDSPAEWLLTGVVPALVTALVAIVFVAVAVQLCFPLHVGVIGALMLVFTTPVWAYGRELYSENLQCLLVLLLLWCLLRIQQAARRRLFILGGVLCGLLLLAKFPLAVMPGFAGLFLVSNEWGWRQWRSFLGYGALGAAPFLAAFLVYNYIRFGGVLEQGYSDPRTLEIGFGTPFYSGLHGLLFSSGKSVFLYAPVLLISLFGIAALWRRQRATSVFALSFAAFLFGMMSLWWSGLGDWGWGPRLVLPAVPVLCLFALEPLVHWRGIRRAALALVPAAGFVINLLGIVIDHSHYLWVVSQITQRGLQMHRAGGLMRDDLAIVHFVPEFSPPIGHFWLLDVYFGKWHDDHWTPWQSMRVPAWDVTFDPTPPFLNHWSNGSPIAWTVIGVTWLVIFALGGCLFRWSRIRSLPDTPKDYSSD